MALSPVRVLGGQITPGATRIPISLLAPAFLHGLIFGSVYPKRLRECLLGLIPIGAVSIVFLALATHAAEIGTGDMRGLGILIVLGLAAPTLATISAGILVGWRSRPLTHPIAVKFSDYFATKSTVQKASIAFALAAAALYIWIRPFIQSSTPKPPADEFDFRSAQ